MRGQGTRILACCYQALQQSTGQWAARGLCHQTAACAAASRAVRTSEPGGSRAVGYSSFTPHAAFSLARFGQGRALSSSSYAASDPVKTEEKVPEDEFDHATGMERAELEGLRQNMDIFNEDWITKSFEGTPADPVVVTSAYDERVVGVPDPEDDCLVIWDIIRAGEPPKQIIEGGEYFVLKQVEPDTWTAIPDSLKGDVHH